MFAVSVVLTLAIGIGLNTVAFTVVNGLLFNRAGARGVLTAGTDSRAAAGSDAGAGCAAGTVTDARPVAVARQGLDEPRSVG